MKVTVCLASYNGALYIEEQISSILESMREANVYDYEILVSDDGSNDETCLLVSRFRNSRLRLIKGPRNGLVKNFEHLLYQAKGTYVFLSDQDDVWLINKVKVCIDHLSHADLVVSDAVVVNSSKETIKRSFFLHRGSGPGLFKNLYKNTYLGCCMCFNREKLLEINCVPFPNKIPMHDWWIGLKFDLSCTVKFIDEPLILYRRHGGNVSPSSENSNYSLFERLQWRWILLKNMVKTRGFI